MSRFTSFYTLTKRELARFLSVPVQTIIPSLVTTILYVLIFGFTLGSRIAEIEGVSYIVFIIPGLVMLNALNASYSNPSSSLLISKYTNGLENILIAPLSYLESAMAFVLAGMIRGVIIGAGTLIMATIFVSMTIHSALLSFLVITLASIAFSSFGLIVGIWADNFDKVSIFPTFIITPLTFLGGVFYSIKLLPEFFVNLSLFNPIFHIVNSFRFAILGISDYPFEISLTITVVAAILPFWLSVYLFKTGYKLKN